jgi:hypothetical protein
VHSLVVRVALRKHVSLRARVENQQHRLENLASGHRLRKSSSYCHVKVAVCGAYSLRQFFDAYARGPGICLSAAYGFECFVDPEINSCFLC